MKPKKTVLKSGAGQTKRRLAVFSSKFEKPVWGLWAEIID